MNQARRNFIAIGAGLVVVIATAGGYEGWRRFANRYPSTPYDDLLSQLSNREEAKQIGRHFIATGGGFVPAHVAAALRQQIRSRPLAAVLQAEVAAGELIEVANWLLPQTLVGLCVLAAKT